MSGWSAATPSARSQARVSPSTKRLASHSKILACRAMRSPSGSNGRSTQCSLASCATARHMRFRAASSSAWCWPRPAQLADRARTQGLWPAERPLPVTLADLVAGLREKPVVDGPLSVAGEQEQRTTDHGQRTTDHQSSIVEVDNIRFSYPSGVEALCGVSLRIGRGERIALLGRNGAGKSTLLRHLNALLLPSSGHVTA